jgi:4-amino-4-deoxy-L-arabinose transferase-like glycosyltransferase
MAADTSVLSSGGRTRVVADRIRSACSQPAVLVVLGGAFALRVVVLLTARGIPLRDDSADYARLGKLLAHGHGFGDSLLAAGGGPTAFRPPAYPLFLGTVFRATGDSLTAARLLQAVLGTVTVALIGIIAWQLFDRRHGLIAAGIAAVYPPLVLTGNGVLTEAISLPLEMLVLVLALRYRRSGRGGLTLPALIGLLIGICVLTRPANVALAIPIVLLLTTSWRGRGLVPAAVAVGVLLVTLAPWQIRNQIRFDEFVPLTTGEAFVVGGVYNDQAAHDPHNRAVWRSPTFVPGLANLFDDRALDESELADALRGRGTDYAKEHPGYVPVVIATNFVYLFDLSGFERAETGHASLGYGAGWSKLWTISYWAVALLALCGAFTRKVRDAPLAVWLIPVLFVLVTIPTLGTARYRAPIEPFLVLLAAAAIAHGLERRKARSV